MDTELARTFLTVATSGNFLAAASRLHVTQSTVSARIATLEMQLGARLFQRGRNGAELTAAGKRFLRHAKNLVRTVEQARHDVGLPQGFNSVLTLSARIALWQGFLPHWTAWMRLAMPHVSLRLEIGFEADIMQGLVEGTIDIGLMYTPVSRSGLVVEKLFDEKLLLVTNDRDRPWPDPDYVHIDWGPEFHAQYAEHYASAPPPALVANVGWLGLQQLLTSGGSVYLPQRLVRRHIENGELWRVAQAAVFKLPAYVVHPAGDSGSALKHALDGLFTLAREEAARD